MDTQILQKIQNYIFELSKNELPTELVYHNYECTGLVVNISNETAVAEKLDESNI